MKRGFTLVELMFVLAVIMIVGWVALGLLSSGTMIWYSGSASMAVQQEMRRSLNSMTKELEQTRASVLDSFMAAPNVPANGLTYNTITFRVPEDRDGNGTVLDSQGAVEWSDAITYQLVFNAAIGSFQLTRTVSGIAGSTVLANYIPSPQSLRFRRQAATPNVIEISLDAQKTSPLGHISRGSISGEVRMRN